VSQSLLNSGLFKQMKLKQKLLLVMVMSQSLLNSGLFKQIKKSLTNDLNENVSIPS